MKWWIKTFHLYFVFTSVFKMGYDTYQGWFQGAARFLSVLMNTCWIWSFVQKSTYLLSWWAWSGIIFTWLSWNLFHLCFCFLDGIFFKTQELGTHFFPFFYLRVGFTGSEHVFRRFVFHFMKRMVICVKTNSGYLSFLCFIFFSFNFEVSLARL